MLRRFQTPYITKKAVDKTVTSHTPYLAYKSQKLFKPGKASSLEASRALPGLYQFEI